MLNIKISIDDGNGKKAEIELNESDSLSKLIIVQNVFNLFGIDTDVVDMARTYNRIGKAYESFFNQVNPVEKSKEEIQLKSQEIQTQMIEGLTVHKDEIEETYKQTKDQPEFVTTGIKVDPDGKKRYRLRYKCPACWNAGNHYVPENSKHTWCHRCQHEMIALPAHPKGFPNQDTFGNFFRAGDFQDWNIIE